MIYYNAIKVVITDASGVFCVCGKLGFGPLAEVNLSLTTKYSFSFLVITINKLISPALTNF